MLIVSYGTALGLDRRTLLQPSSSCAHLHKVRGWHVHVYLTPKPASRYLEPPNFLPKQLYVYLQDLMGLFLGLSSQGWNMPQSASRMASGWLFAGMGLGHESQVFICLWMMPVAQSWGWQDSFEISSICLIGISKENGGEAIFTRARTKENPYQETVKL